MTLVRIETEDRTGGGLELVLRKAAQRRRERAGLPPLSFEPVRHCTNNNALLRRVESVQLALNTGSRPDHVFYVMDARNCWTLLRIAEPTPPRTAASMPLHLDQARAAMRAHARSGSDGQTWDGIAHRCHCHVLLWERESIILPVAQRLGFAAETKDVFGIMDASGWVKRHWSERKEAFGFSKALGTKRCLDQLAEDAALCEEAVAANETLEAIVAELVHL